MSGEDAQREQAEVRAEARERNAAWVRRRVAWQWQDDVDATDARMARALGVSEDEVRRAREALGLPARDGHVAGLGRKDVRAIRAAAHRGSSLGLAFSYGVSFGTIGRRGGR